MSENNELTGLPAMIYTALWPYKIDGRFRYSMKDVVLSIVVEMVDFPPVTLIEIINGDFTIKALPDVDLESIMPDIRVKGRFGDAIQAIEGLGKILKLIATRKIRVKGKRKAFVLRKLFNARGFELDA